MNFIVLIIHLLPWFALGNVAGYFIGLKFWAKKYGLEVTLK